MKVSLPEEVDEGVCVIVPPRSSSGLTPSLAESLVGAMFVIMATSSYFLSCKSLQQLSDSC